MATHTNLLVLRGRIDTARERFEAEVIRQFKAGTQKAVIARAAGVTEGTIRAIVNKHIPDAPDARTMRARRTA